MKPISIAKIDPDVKITAKRKEKKNLKERERKSVEEMDLFGDDALKRV